jgi:hypothetical protein
MRIGTDRLMRAYAARTRALLTDRDVQNLALFIVAAGGTNAVRDIWGGALRAFAQFGQPQDAVVCAALPLAAV